MKSLFILFIVLALSVYFYEKKEPAEFKYNEVGQNIWENFGFENNTKDIGLSQNATK